MERYVNCITKQMNYVSHRFNITHELFYYQDCLRHKTLLCFECCYIQRCGDGNNKVECDILRKSEFDDLISTKLNKLNALIEKSSSIFESEIQKMQLRIVTYKLHDNSNYLNLSYLQKSIQTLLVTLVSLSNEIKNNPRTAILTEYAEPKHFMINVFVNCDIFEEDWKQNSELIKSQVKEIAQMRKRIEELENNQIQLRPTRSRSLYSLDSTLFNDTPDEQKVSVKPSMTERSDEDDRNDGKIFISGLPQFSSMSLSWQKG